MLPHNRGMENWFSPELVALIQEAVSPLLVRGHVMPGEEHDSDPANSPGGSEQFMHVTGTVEFHGEVIKFDAVGHRDHSCGPRHEDAARDVTGALAADGPGRGSPAR